MYKLVHSNSRSLISFHHRGEKQKVTERGYTVIPKSFDTANKINTLKISQEFNTQVSFFHK